MKRTIEERIEREIDTLWQAALFLGGGDQRVAERILGDGIAAAATQDRDALRVEDGPDGLERFLVRRFFHNARHLYVAPEYSTTYEPVDGVEPDVDALLREAGRIPCRPRAALWLVMIRRRSYAEGASILGIDKAELRPLLEHREVLMAELIGRSTQKLADGVRQGPEESAS